MSAEPSPLSSPASVPDAPFFPNGPQNAGNVIDRQNFFDALARMPLTIAPFDATCPICLQNIPTLPPDIPLPNNTTSPAHTASTLLRTAMVGVQPNTDTLGFPALSLPILLNSCAHVVCASCLHQYAVTRLREEGVRSQIPGLPPGIPCPVPGCGARLSEDEAMAVLAAAPSGSALVNQYERGMVEAGLETASKSSLTGVAARQGIQGVSSGGSVARVDGLRPCRGTNCRYMVWWQEDDADLIPEPDQGRRQRMARDLDFPFIHFPESLGAMLAQVFGADPPESAPQRSGHRGFEVTCPLCSTKSCARCGRVPYHGKRTCETAFEQDGDYALRASVLPATQRSRASADVHRQARSRTSGQDHEIRACPGCGVGIVLREGCSKVQCRCGARFCMKCGSIGARCDCTGREHIFYNNVTNRPNF